jgi:hypothetical protein
MLRYKRWLPCRVQQDSLRRRNWLPESERDTPEWRLAVQMLIDAAEDQGPMLFARMGIERALERTQNHSTTGGTVIVLKRS